MLRNTLLRVTAADFLYATNKTNSLQLNPSRDITSRPASHTIPHPLRNPIVPYFYQMPAHTRHFSPIQNAQTRSETHPASHLMGARGSFPSIKRPGFRLTTHLHPVFGLKMCGAINPRPPACLQRV